MRNPFRRASAEEKALSAARTVLEALADRRVNFYPALGGTNVTAVSAAVQRGMNAQYGWIYGTQPSVRSVIDFVARNLAQLHLKLYDRVSDTDRKRVEDHPAAQVLAYPDDRVTREAFIYRLVTDFLIYDNAFVLKLRPSNGNGRLFLVRLPPSAVVVAGGRITPDQYIVYRWDGSPVTVRPEDMLHWYGYAPDDPLVGMSKLETLRQELSSDMAIQAALVDLAQNGLKGGYIERPLEASEASPEALARIAEQWRAGKLRGDPILDEGMKFVQMGVTPEDAELQTARKFTMEQVASLYGVPLLAMGIGDGSPADQRKLVYQDVLPPLGDQLACQLTADLLREEWGAPSLYWEFDYNTKLQGDLENRYPQFTASAGAPWLTRNEVRAKENLPPIEGADDLILPLNVMEEEPGSPALPAPNVMPPQDATKPPADGSYRSGEGETQAEPAKGLAKAVPGAVAPENHLPQYQTRVRNDMARQRRNTSELQTAIYNEYRRQHRVLSSSKAALGAERWDAEMQAAIGPLITGIVLREGDLYCARLGGLEFDERQVGNYLRAMITGTAEGLNEATRRDIAAVGLDEAYKRATGQRAAVAGQQIAARATYFGRTEGAQQAPHPERRVQRWVANTDRHAELDGATAPLDGDWGGLSPGSEANCGCGVDIG